MRSNLYYRKTPSEMTDPLIESAVGVNQLLLTCEYQCANEGACVAFVC